MESSPISERMNQLLQTRLERKSKNKSKSTKYRPALPDSLVPVRKRARYQIARDSPFYETLHTCRMKLLRTAIEDLIGLEDRMQDEMDTPDFIAAKESLQTELEEGNAFSILSNVVDEGVALNASNKKQLKAAVDSIINFVTATLVNKPDVLNPASESISCIRAIVEAIKIRMMRVKLIKKATNSEKAEVQILDDLFNVLVSANTAQRQFSVLCRFQFDTNLIDPQFAANYTDIYELSRVTLLTKCKKASRKAAFLLEALIFLFDIKETQALPAIRHGDYFLFINDEWKYYCANVPRPLVDTEDKFPPKYDFLLQWRDHVQMFMRSLVDEMYVDRLMSLLEQTDLEDTMNREIASGVCVDPLRVLVTYPGQGRIPMFKHALPPADFVYASPLYHKFSEFLSNSTTAEKKAQWTEFQLDCIYFAEYHQAIWSDMIVEKEEEERLLEELKTEIAEEDEEDERKKVEEDIDEEMEESENEEEEEEEEEDMMDTDEEQEDPYDVETDEE